jgi:hypothetical protein
MLPAIKMKKTILLIILLSVPFLGKGSYCEYLIINKHFENAEYIFIGTVIKKVGDSTQVNNVDEQGSMIKADFYEAYQNHLKVEKVYKGNLQEELIIKTSDFIDNYYFEEGVPYIVYAFKRGKIVVTNWCTLTGKLVSSKETIEWLENRSGKTQSLEWISANNLKDSTSKYQIDIRDSGLASIITNKETKEGLYKIKANKIVIKFIDYNGRKLYRFRGRQKLKIVSKRESEIDVRLDNELITLKHSRQH